MSDLPQGYFRNEAARAMAERVRNRVHNKTSAQELIKGMQWNIDRMLPNLDPEVLEKINSAICAEKDFILYLDTENYCIVVPKHKGIQFVRPGDELNKLCETELEFQNQVRIAAVTYPKYLDVPTQIDNGQSDQMLQLR